LGATTVLAKVGSVAPVLANFALHNPVSRLLAEKVMGITRGPAAHLEYLGHLRGLVRTPRRPSGCVRPRKLSISTAVRRSHCEPLYRQGCKVAGAPERNGYAR
jgi:hypothetical protein